MALRKPTPILLVVLFRPFYNLYDVSRYPEMLSFYIAITFPLIIPKVAYFVWWFNVSYAEIYSHFVVSPLTDRVPTSRTALIPESDIDSSEFRPYSWKRRIIISILCLFICGMAVPWLLFSFGDGRLPWLMDAGFDTERMLRRWYFSAALQVRLLSQCLYASLAITLYGVGRRSRDTFDVMAVLVDGNFCDKKMKYADYH